MVNHNYTTESLSGQRCESVTYSPYTYVCKQIHSCIPYIRTLMSYTTKSLILFTCLQKDGICYTL